MMTKRTGIDIEAIMTVHDECAISCEVDDDEARFTLGRTLDGLRLDFDLSALEKFMGVAQKVMDQISQIPRGERIGFAVYADDHSRKEHVPELKQDGGIQVVAEGKHF
jgi:hypothetical protein